MTHSHEPDALAAAAAAADALHAEGSDERRRANVVQMFEDWCVQHDRCPFPSEPHTLRQYLCTLAAAGFAPGTIRNYESAVRQRHLDAGLASPGLHGAEGDRMSLILAGITKSYVAARKQAPPLTVVDLYRALTYDHRSRTVRRNQTVTALARHCQIPVRIAERIELVGTDGDDIRIAHPPTERLNAPREEWVIAVIQPGDRTATDPHHQLEMLIEVLNEDDVGTPLGWLGPDPGTKLVKPGLTTKINRLLRGVGELSRLDDDRFVALMYRLDRQWLMRIQMDAMVVLLFAGALRGVECRRTRVHHWRYKVHANGVTLRLPGAKAQLGDADGSEVEIPVDLGGVDLIFPVALVDLWIAVAGLEPDDLLFPGMKGVGNDPDRIDVNAGPITAEALIARLGRLSGDASLAARLTGHSGRRGFATEAAESGVELRQLANHMRHQRFETLQLYIDRRPPQVYGWSVAAAMAQVMEDAT